ncbi:MAG TPA: ATP/GTP-binding protein [Streptosporangiaceae bacterium]
MSPRRSRRARPTTAPWPLGPERPESWPDGDWVVRQIPGAAATKEYRCPGCDQEILPGTPHVVAWPAEAPGAEMRRHWHRTCWERRLTRRPGRR